MIKFLRGLINSFTKYAVTYENLSNSEVTKTKSVPIRPTQGLKRPVAKKYRISSPFGMRGMGMHWGIDFACPTGSLVRAAIDGKVIKVGWQDKNDKKKGFGKRVWAISQYEGKTYDVFYAHLSDISVTKGQFIEKGQVIGRSGNTGHSTGPHLHFQMRPTDLSVKGVEVEFE